MSDPLPAGARFVLINGALARVGLTLDDINLPFNWKVGPSRRDIGDVSYLQASHAFRGEGLKPMSPVHIRASRDGFGNIAVTWLRRTRWGGDSWKTADVPLGEDSERYEVDIVDGGVVRRTLSATVPAVAYGAAEQTLDFGGLQSSVELRVYQLSDVAGRGSGRTAIV